MGRRTETVGGPEGRFKCGFPRCTYSKDNEIDVKRHRALAGHDYATAAATVAALEAQADIWGNQSQPALQIGVAPVPDQPHSESLDQRHGHHEGGACNSLDSGCSSNHAADEQYQGDVPDRPEESMDMQGPEEQQLDGSQMG